MTERGPDLGIGTVEVTVEVGGKEAVRVGDDLNDVVADILRDMRVTAGWSESELARRIGMSQANLNRLLSGKDRRPQGISLGVFSQICAALRLDAVRFLASHDLYREENRATHQLLEDAIFDRLRSALDLEAAKILLEIVESAVRGGVLDRVLEAVRTLTEHATAGRVIEEPDEARRARKSR